MLSFLANIFGYVLNFIYGIVNNYGVAIILFSILLKLILLPISFKQQKTMKKSLEIQEKSKELQDKYKNDPEKMQAEIMKLYKKEKMNPASGCLSSIIQIILLLAMFVLVKEPITYMKKVDTTNFKSYIQNEIGVDLTNSRYPEISVVKYISKIKNNEIELKNEEIDENENEEVEDEAEENEITIEKNTENETESNEDVSESAEVEEDKAEENVNITMEDVENAYINMNFLGMDLSNVPQENLNNPTVYIIPLLYVVTSIISMKMTTSNQSKNKKKEENDVIELNTEEKAKKEEEVDMSQQMTKNMNWFMPIMSVSISIIAPLGLALYWLVNNVLMIIERLVVNKIMDSREENKNV